MMRQSVVFWLGLTAAAGGVLFHTSYRVQELDEQLAAINRNIVTEQEAIQVLKAEWSYLNEPTRLESMVHEHLPLRATGGDQIASAETIPMRSGTAVAQASTPAAPVGSPSAQDTAAPPIKTASAIKPVAAAAASTASASVRKPSAAPALNKPVQAAVAPAARPAQEDQIALLLAKLGAVR